MSQERKVILWTSSETERGAKRDGSVISLSHLLYWYCCLNSKHTFIWSDLSHRGHVGLKISFGPAHWYLELGGHCCHFL